MLLSSQLAHAQADKILCTDAIAPIERAAQLPPQLLHTIAIVESGRRDPQTGRVAPWPWTINAEGTGSFYESRDQAVAAVMALQARGVRSIDVGCMQINLMHHPLAFSSLEQAFDPAANVTYAARFLKQLFAETTRPFMRAIAALGHWHVEQEDGETASALYHELLAINPSDSQGIRHRIAELEQVAPMASI